MHCLRFPRDRDSGAYCCLSFCSESCCSFSQDRQHSLHSSVCLCVEWEGQLGLGYMRPFNQLRPELSPKEPGGSPMGVKGQINQ